MSKDVLILCEHIIELLEARDDATPIAEIERTLTDGYAQAHLLEAERRRIDRRITELARDAEAQAGELAKLSKRATRASSDLVRLRELLVALRRHHAALRAA